MRWLRFPTDGKNNDGLGDVSGILQRLVRVWDIQGIPEPFTVELTLFQEQEIDEDVRNLSVGMILKNTQWNSGDCR